MSKALPFLHLLIALNLPRIPYPNSRRDLTVVDNYFGAKISDPYRWLENLNSDETKKFVQTQQRLTQNFLESIPERSAIRQRVKEAWNYPRQSAPQRVGSRYYTLENPGLQNHSIIYVREGLYGTPRIFFDPATLSVDDTVTVESYAFSGDGRYFAYLVQSKGSDWKTIKFKNVQTGVDLPDVLVNTKAAGVVWTPDSKGVFYTRFPVRRSKDLSEITLFESLFYHKLGTPQSRDILIATFPKAPSLRLSVQLTQDLNYLLIRGAEGFNASSVYLVPLWEGVNEYLKYKTIPIFPSSTEDLYEYIGNEGPMFLFRTSKGASNYKIARVKINAKQGLAPGRRVEYWSTVVEEHPSRVLDWATPLSSDLFLLRYIDQVEHTLEIRSLKYGRPMYRLDVEPGSMTDFSLGYIDGQTLEFFIKMENFLNPGTTYRCLLSGYYVNCDVFHQTRVNVDLRNYISELVPFRSKDGALIPMHVVRKRDMKLDGSAPALLYGYGGFNVGMMPRFSITSLMFMERFGGIYAQAVIRGGGEFGTNWYKAGALLNKQRSFDDFQAAAEFLLARNYTSPSKLAIQGGSHGGLLVAACVNQRPELYGAAIAQNGVMDLLRHQYFTGGQIWCREYGCSNNRIYFDNLQSYSPLHNIRVPPKEEVQYPAVFVMAADHDDRVVPSHSYKYIAELQHTVGKSPKQKNPLLLRISEDAGHSNGKSTHKLIEDVTDLLSFVAETLGLSFKVTVSDAAEETVQFIPGLWSFGPTIP